MIGEPIFLENSVPPGPRFALQACALALGASSGPTLLRSTLPDWEQVLRGRVGDQLFTLEDPARPAARAWSGAVWLEPQRGTWKRELQEITRELPRGALLSIVLSLPLAFLRGDAPHRALGARPSGIWRLRAELYLHGFRVERAFSFHTPWWSGLRWLAARIRMHRPDLGDRVQYLMRRHFAAGKWLLPISGAGLIEARAGMRP